jgi:hypothetical protein
VSADYDNMLAKLQMQLSQQQQGQNNPSLFGLQAAPDPNSTAALLKHLQDQQYVAQQGNPGGDWADQFGQAGKKDFARAGQNIGNMLGIGRPPQMDNSGVMAQRSAIQGGKTDLAQGLSQPGADPNQVQIQVLTKLAQAGVPGAAEQLEKANDNAQKLATEKATAFAANSKGAASLDEIRHRAAAEAHQAFEEDGQTWHYVSTTDGVAQYVNGHGEPKVVTVQPSKTIPGAPLDPTVMAGAAKDVANYKIPENQIYGRGMTASQKADFHAQVIAANPDYDQRTFKQSNDAIKAYGPQGTLGQQTLKLQNAINHLGLLDQYGKALDSGDMKTANAVSNKLSQEFGGTAISGYNSIAPIVASEVSGALVKGGGGVEERAEKARELGSQLSSPQRTAATQGMRDLLKAQYGNYSKNYEKTTRRKDFQEMFPIEGGFGGSGGHGGEVPPGAVLNYNPKTGKFE